MIIFPAIDLKGGNCVRLLKGDMNAATVFNESPKNQAQFFEQSGFKFLHIVDLDGAIEGRSVNENSVKDILANIKIPVQLGGGIRSIKDIEKWLNLGVNRAILGTIAVKNPSLVREACKNFPDKILLGIDAKNAMVAVEGWVEESKISVIDLAKKFEDCGAAGLIYTDISRDGSLTGVDLDGTRRLAKSVNIPVIASGGVSSIEDVLEIKKIEPDGVCGVIVGRALYEKKVSISDLLRV